MARLETGLSAISSGIHGASSVVDGSSRAATGSSISAAKLQAYTAVKAIRWEGAWCRKGISDRTLEA